MMQPSLKIYFKNIREIRMGSPFHICDLELEGEPIIKLEKNEYQDIFCWSDDYRFLLLIRWNIDNNNNPGFNTYLLNLFKKKVVISERIEGCCKSVEYANGQFVYYSFRGKDKIIEGAINVHHS